MPSAATFIYCLVDPRDHQVRYVGKADDPQKRYKNHLKLKRERNSHLNNWIRKLQRMGMDPILHIILECPYEIWGEMEKHWIATFRWAGVDLTNVANGGEGGKPNKGLLGRKLSKEHKRKISKAHIGKIVSEEARISMSKGQKRRYQDPEERRKTSVTSSNFKRLPHSKETKQKMSIAARGRKVSIETRQKISATLKGRKRQILVWNKGLTKHTHPSMMSISKKRTGQKPSIEVRKNMSKSQLGKKHSKKTKRKMSVSAKRVWAKRKVNGRDK